MTNIKSFTNLKLLIKKQGEIVSIENEIVIDDNEAIIKLNSKIGKELMDETEFYLREIGITKITLYSLPYIKLKKWYESLEYKHISDINIHQDGKQLTKVHIMRKKL